MHNTAHVLHSAKKKRTTGQRIFITHTYAHTCTTQHSCTSQREKKKNNRTKNLHHTHAHTHLIGVEISQATQTPHMCAASTKFSQWSLAGTTNGQAFGSIPFFQFFHLGSPSIVSQQQQQPVIVDFVCWGCCCARLCSWCRCLLRYVCVAVVAAVLLRHFRCCFGSLLPCCSTFCCRVVLCRVCVYVCVYVRAV